MASGDGSEPKLSGFAKYYNSVTPQGRANVAASTIIAMAATGAYFYFKSKSKSKKSAEK
ncbi:uncharacterized protein LOC117605118 [Osmia lignaria lignaria]|uniref:uncharacterized protein LOC117605118 n=1 Tax=Osmia lignaria lignaria TaxID=1437193 RepID=UPI001478DCAD|nr:uncharacterized protein LOC117605118 [Osmia lignaria]